MKIIILAGGSGTRLWPLSRRACPKQFIKLPGMSESLFQKTFKRSLDISDIDDIYIVTNISQKELILEDIIELGLEYNEERILLEPEAKNTLPAIYAGINEIRKKGNNTVVVFPSDHLIENNEKLIELIKASEMLSKEYLITFGIKPDGPNTGYGYISPGEKKRNGRLVSRFVEKPDKTTAEQYVEQGYLWNAGIFMFSTAVFTDEVKEHSYEIFNAFKDSADIAEAFSKIKTKISIDYGVMEKSNKVCVVEADVGWNDIGSFDALYDISEKDQDGNAGLTDFKGSNAKNNMVNVKKEKAVALIDVDNLIIIDTEDALLVCRRGKSQKVRDIVKNYKLKEEKGKGI